MYQALTLTGLLFCLLLSPLQADESVTTSVGNLYKDGTALNGKQVTLQDKVVKVNNQIMQRNFIHLQDGSGNPKDGTHDITITSQSTANVGDQVKVTGTLVLDHDFGAGYKYPMLVEKATITTSDRQAP
ncbi:MAG: hypothetical protein AAES65_20235 [Candidatus Thiodiazotropha sp. (ex. Lucinoma kazani)]